MNEDIAKQLRAFHRLEIHELWEKAKKNDLGDLDDEQRMIAKIMLEHEDEYFNQFEFADLTAEHEEDPDTEVNPFMHIMIHSIVENQLRQREPLEAFQFYNALRKKKCSRHEIVHMIGMIFAPMMFDVLKQKQPFDNDVYKSVLKKLKGRKPDRIMKMLDEESDSPGRFSEILAR